MSGWQKAKTSTAARPQQQRVQSQSKVQIANHAFNVTQPAPGVKLFFQAAFRMDQARLGRKQPPFQAKMRLTICLGVAERQRPPSNSRRADLTASSRALRRRSARRRCKTSTSDSCSSTPNSSAESNTCAKVFTPCIFRCLNSHLVSLKIIEGQSVSRVCWLAAGNRRVE